MIDGEGEVTTKPPPETAVQAWNPEAGQTAQLDWTAQVVTDPQIGDGKFGLVMFRPDGAKWYVLRVVLQEKDELLVIEG